MQSSIYLALALVAFTTANRLDVGPQVFPEQETSSSTQKLDKRYATEEYTYLNPEVIKTIQKGNAQSEEIQLAKENPLKKQSIDEQLRKWYKQFLPEEPKLEIQGITNEGYLQKQKPNSEIKQASYRYINLYTEEKPKEQTNNKYVSELTKNEPYLNIYWQKEQEDKEKELQKDIKWKTYSSEVTKNEPYINFYWQKEEDKNQQESDLQKDNKWKTFSELKNIEPYEKFYWKKDDGKNQQENNLQKDSKWKTYSSELINIEPYEKFYWQKEDAKNQQESDLQKDNKWKTYSSDVAKNKPYVHFYWPKEDGENQQETDLQKDNKWKTESINNQEEILLNEQLKEQWYRILEHNGKQLKSVSEVPKENKKEVNQSEKPSKKVQSSKSEIEKEIESILKDYGIFESEKQSPKEQDHQRPPIVIQKEVSITKHLPVEIVKKVKVPVPKPVLVPVPEAYEVKVPHPYPVPVHIVKHIPVPVVRAH